MAVIVRDDQSQYVPDGDSVMGACESLNVPFLCRGGGCGACRSEIIEGLENLAPRSANEEWYNKNYELREGQRLLCQTRITSGLVRINPIGPATPPLQAQETEPAIPLTQLGPGKRAIIVSLESDDSGIQRLMEMGFVPGTQIEIMQTGDPLLTRINGSKIGLRKSLAAGILVNELNQ